MHDLLCLIMEIYFITLGLCARTLYAQPMGSGRVTQTFRPTIHPMS